MDPALGGNRVKHLSPLFLMASERGDQRFIGTKLLLCLLISVSVHLMSGCDKDIEDLSQKDLNICWITIEDPTLHANHTTDLTAELIYDGEDRELRYNWSVLDDKGKIHNNGKRATYLAPKEAGTYLIRFEVCNGPIRVSDTVSVRVVPDPNAPDVGEAQDAKQPKDAENQNPAEPDPANAGNAEPAQAEDAQDADKPANAGEAEPAGE